MDEDAAAQHEDPAPDGGDRSAAGPADERPPTGPPGPADPSGSAGPPAAPAGDPQVPTGGPSQPSGEVYDWYRRGLALLEQGNADAAAQLLRHARAAEPESAAILEALARSLFDAGRYQPAAAAFADLADLAPDDDYARFGLGLSLTRLDRFEAAAEQLALAAAMRPQRREYAEALRQARATLAARADAAEG